MMGSVGGGGGELGAREGSLVVVEGSWNLGLGLAAHWW